MYDPLVDPKVIRAVQNAFDQVMPMPPEEGMNGPPGTPSAPLEEALVKPVSRWDSMFHLRWDSMYDDFYQKMLPEGSQAGNFDLTIPEEEMDLALWGGTEICIPRKVV